MTELVIDQVVFVELVQTTGQEFVAELIDSFLEDAPQMLAALCKALNTHDAASFRRTAHSLKSNAASFGAMTLCTQAREFELLGLAGLADTATSRLVALTQSYEEAAIALKRLRNA